MKRLYGPQTIRTYIVSNTQSVSDLLEVYLLLKEVGLFTPAEPSDGPPRTQIFQPAGGVPLLSLLRGTGSTLTSYIFDNAPTGELNQPQKAYAGAFVLLLIVLALNVIVNVFGRRAKELRWS